MEKTKIINFLKSNRGGTYTNIVFLSDVASNKDHKDHRVQKMVAAVTRFKVTYSHIKVDSIQFKNRAVDGERELPWGEWDPECGCLIAHKDNHYLRCTISRSPKHKRVVLYLIDGAVVSKEKAMEYTRPSEWTRSSEDCVYNPKISNVIALGDEAKEMKARMELGAI